MASYNDIDYRLRVAKSVERKMLCSLFQCLSAFQPLKDYQYIGMGSVSFIDFSLFHRNLGINKMISIEREEHDKIRFDFNKPFNCIDIEFGESQDVLPKLSLHEKSIIWLDYDSKLDTRILSDLELVFYRLPSGSFLSLSFNALHDREENGLSRYDMLAQRIDTNYFPSDLNDQTLLNKKGLRKIYYQIINLLIQETLERRRENGENVFVKQVVYITYNDGVEMNTLGWIFFNENEKNKITSIVDIDMPFLRFDEDPFNISIPKLTFKEIKAIESLFPNISLCKKHFEKNNQGGFLAHTAISSHFEIYKYFSPFAETYL